MIRGGGPLQRRLIPSAEVQMIPKSSSHDGDVRWSPNSLVQRSSKRNTAAASEGPYLSIAADAAILAADHRRDAVGKARAEPGGNTCRPAGQQRRGSQWGDADKRCVVVVEVVVAVEPDK